MSPTPPAHASTIILSFPSPHVLLLTFNRPDALNSVTPDMRKDLERVLDWFEAEDELWVLVLTGNGRIFCSGVDLKDWTASLSPTAGTEKHDQQSIVDNPHGFASLSRRMTAKPIIAAVNGGAYGGGMEVVLNCDLVVADEKAKVCHFHDTRFKPSINRSFKSSPYQKCEGALAPCRAVSPD